MYYFWLQLLADHNCCRFSNSISGSFSVPAGVGAGLPPLHQIKGQRQEILFKVRQILHPSLLGWRLVVVCCCVQITTESLSSWMRLSTSIHSLHQQIMLQVPPAATKIQFPPTKQYMAIPTHAVMWQLCLGMKCWSITMPAFSHAKCMGSLTSSSMPQVTSRKKHFLSEY